MYDAVCMRWHYNGRNYIFTKKGFPVKLRGLPMNERVKKYLSVMLAYGIPVMLIMKTVPFMSGYLKGLDAVAFSTRAAYYLGEINALHPFREGNGRAQREFINHLAFRNGYFIEWKNISQQDMIQASIESFHKADNAKFAAFICNNLRELPVADSSKTAPLKRTKNQVEPE